jgi:RNA polymerase sigma-70 factor (ECF subfamily)
MAARQTDMDLTVRRVIAGDTDAYAEIVRLYQKDVTKVVAAMLFDRQESEDLVQDVFVKAFEHLDQFQRGRDMGLWLKGIARNTVRMHLRRRKTIHKHLQTYRAWLLRRFEESAPDAYQEDMHRALLECMDDLPEHSRRIMEMKYRQGMAIAGIGEAVGRSLDAVAKALSRIRETLRDCVRERIAAT